jgi:hypothetical protein
MAKILLGTSLGAIAVGKTLIFSGQSKAEYWVPLLCVAATSFILFLIVFMSGKDSTPSRKTETSDGKKSASH